MSQRCRRGSQMPARAFPPHAPPLLLTPRRPSQAFQLLSHVLMPRLLCLLRHPGVIPLGTTKSP